MSDPTSTHEPLTVKRYANRRFYDNTRSRHLTLREMYDLVRAGHDLIVIDSKSGDDITNLILTQMLLERDPPKLDALPTNVLHQLIRTQQQLIGTAVEQYFRQMFEAQRVSHEGWQAFMQRILGIETLPGGGAPLRDTSPHEPVHPTAHPAAGEADLAPPASAEEELRELRRQLEELRHRVESAYPQPQNKTRR